MSDMDRRELLRRAGAGALVLALPGDALLGETTAAARVSERKLRELARRVRGPVVGPGERGYRRAARVYNERFDGKRPDAIVEAVSTDDVKEAVRWAGKHDVRVTARSGGHSYEGYSTTSEGIVVDLSRMHDIRVERGARRATVEGGCQLIDVYDKLARKGGTIPAGSCPSVGIGGLALGGGMGLASRKLGLTCDNVVGLTIVTADGSVRRIDAASDPDLFWACQGGGGGNFGIVTSFDFHVHPVDRAAYFHVSWPWSNAGRALEAWQEFAPEAPAALTSIMNLSAGGGGTSITALGQFFGSERRLRRLIRPLARVDGARVSTGTSSYMSLQMRWAGCLDRSVRACHTRGAARGGRLPRDSFYAGSDYVERRLSAKGRQRLLATLERRRRDGALGSGAVILDAYGGAINRVDPAATAFVHRDQLFSVQYIAYFPNRSGRGRRAAKRWIRGAQDDLRRHISGQAYQNYIDRGLRDWERAYYGRNLERLVAVKTRYDPDERFRFAQGIRPLG